MEEGQWGKYGSANGEIRLPMEKLALENYSELLESWVASDLVYWRARWGPSRDIDHVNTLRLQFPLPQAELTSGKS